MGEPSEVEDQQTGGQPDPARDAAAPVSPDEGTGELVVPASPPVRVLDAPNEAVPPVAPTEESVATGSIPAAHKRRIWSRVHGTNWRLFLVRFLSAGLSVTITVAIVPGLSFTDWRWGQMAIVGLVFGLLNAIVKPLLQFLVLRYIFSSYGIVVVLINVLMLILLAELMPGTFEATGLLPVIVGGLVLGIVGLLLDTLLGANPPVLDRDYKERNGLK